MPNITDTDLVYKLLEATGDERIDWRKADVQDRFTAVYANKWTLIIDKSHSPDSPYPSYWLALSNTEGEELLRITHSEVQEVSGLYELARRHALGLKEAIADLMKDLSKPQS